MAEDTGGVERLSDEEIERQIAAHREAVRTLTKERERRRERRRRAKKREDEKRLRKERDEYAGRVRALEVQLREAREAVQPLDHEVIRQQVEDLVGEQIRGVQDDLLAARAKVDQLERENRELRQQASNRPAKVPTQPANATQGREQLGKTGDERLRARFSTSHHWPSGTSESAPSTPDDLMRKAARPTDGSGRSRP